MTKADYKAVPIEELISYSKQKEVPAVVIIYNVSDEDFKYIDIILEMLKLRTIIFDDNVHLSI